MVYLLSETFLGDSMKYFRFLSVLIIFICCFILIYFVNFYHNLDSDIDNINFNKYDKLMIVAHPDDETLWGGGHLIDDNYVVVCVTCGKNKIRLNEIRRVLKKTDDNLISLWYPDKVRGKRSDWKKCYDNIENDLDKVINAYDWKVIVTHNTDGEYGHIHHKMLNKMVTDIYDREDIEGKLFYFGKYYTKSNVYVLRSKQNKYNPNSINEKKKLIKMYHSQGFIKKMFNHMTEYEDWIEYEKKEG